MNALWAARIPETSLAAASSLRLRPVEFCTVADQVWLRGSEPFEQIQAALAALPGAQLFMVSADGLIVPAGARVPTGRLPARPWVALSNGISVTAPTSALPGTLPKKVPLRLIRTENIRESNLLVATCETWRDFALSISTVRLRPLKFALSSSHAVIWGRPVPAIAGVQYVEDRGLAVPSGFALHPLSDPEILRPLLQLSEGDLALFREDGQWDVIVGGLFVSATRSAVRQSFAATPVENDAT